MSKQAVRTVKFVSVQSVGMMENEAYRESTYNKLKLYGQAEIIPSVNLITTFETKSCPLDSEKIQKMIDENLLKK